MINCLRILALLQLAQWWDTAADNAPTRAVARQQRSKADRLRALAAAEIS